MRALDYAPFFRSTVGFDRLFDWLTAEPVLIGPLATSRSWVRTNIGSAWQLAGFGADEIELVQEGNTLTVSGAKRTEREARHEMLHQGLAFRNFCQTFNLAARVKVESASLENGLLSVQLVREIPEQMKPRQIKVGAAQATISHQDNQSRPGSEQPYRQPQAV